MENETKTKRGGTITLRLPAGKRAELDAMVRTAGTSRNAFILGRIFGRVGGTFADVKRTVAPFLPVLADLKDQLHDIRMSGTASECGLLLEEIRDLLLEIRAALFLLLRRKP